MPDVFPFQPDNLTFTLEWLTKVTQAYRFEQADQMRLIPRLMFAMDMSLSADSARHALDLLEANHTGLWFGDYRYMRMFTRVSDTSFSVSTGGWSYAAGQHVVIAHNGQVRIYEVLSESSPGVFEVDSDITGWHKHAWIMPALFAIAINEPSISLVGNNEVRLSATIECQEYVELSTAREEPLLHGAPSFLKRSVSVGQTYGFAQNLSFVDNQTGVATVVRKMVSSQERFALATKINMYDELFDLECRLHAVAGRANPVWVSTWLNEFTLKYPIFDVSDKIYVTTNVAGLPAKTQAVVLAYKDGYVSLHRVSVATADPETMILTLLDPVHRYTRAEDLLGISRAGLHRLDSDRIEFKVEPGFTASFNVPTIEVFP